MIFGFSLHEWMDNCFLRKFMNIAFNTLSSSLPPNILRQLFIRIDYLQRKNNWPWNNKIWGSKIIKMGNTYHYMLGVKITTHTIHLIMNWQEIQRTEECINHSTHEHAVSKIQTEKSKDKWPFFFLIVRKEKRGREGNSVIKRHFTD